MGSSPHRPARHTAQYGRPQPRGATCTQHRLQRVPPSSQPLWWRPAANQPSAVARLHRRPGVPGRRPAPLRALLIAMTADSPSTTPPGYSRRRSGLRAAPDRGRRRRPQARRLARGPAAREVAARLTELTADAGSTVTTDLAPRPRTPMLVAAATIVALIAVGLGEILVGTATPTSPAATAGSVPPTAGPVPVPGSPTLPAPAAPAPVPVAARPAPGPSVPGNGASSPRRKSGRSETGVGRYDRESGDPEDSYGAGDENEDEEKGNGKRKSKGDKES